MFIQTEETPNPLTLKFVPGKTVIEGDPIHFKNVEEAEKYPLAQKLFSVGGVTSVFFGRDFISVSKDESTDWLVLKPEILGEIMEHYLQNDYVLSPDHAPVEKTSYIPSPEEETIVKEIIDLLDTKIRPAVAMDGGDIVFDRFEEGIVFLQLKGACAGCPSSSATLKSGIESMLKHYIPEVIEVRAV